MENPVIFSAPVISFAKVACAIQLSALQREVDYLVQNPWVDHVNKNDYVGAWDVMPLRCQREHLNAHPILQGFAKDYQLKVIN